MRIRSTVKLGSIRFRPQLNKFEYWVFKKILIKLIFRRNQIWLYDQVYQVSHELFFEDNFYDHASTMKFCMEAAINNNCPDELIPSWRINTP